jgi:hypothetical protein
VNLWSCEKIKTGPVIPDAIIAHHTPMIMACNGVSGINMGFSADEFLLF